MSDKKLLLLDFDGVIADTFHIGHAIAQKMCVYITEREYRKRFEGNINEADRALLSVDHGDRCDHLLDYWAQYAPGFKTHARPFAGTPELVKEFARTYTICIVSSSNGDLIEHFLEKYELQSCVESVWGNEISPRKDEKFGAIFAKYSVAPADCIFVTDTLGDINEASTVGLTSIGVTWGFQDRATLSRGNPFAIVDSPQELPAAIEKYFASA